MPIIFREQKGSVLTAAEVDNNFKELQERLCTLEDEKLSPETFSKINLEDGKLTFEGSKGSTFGPFSLPNTPLSTKGFWAPQTPYTQSDLVQHEKSLYSASHDHISGDVFSPNNWNVVFKADLDSTSPLQAPVYESENLPEPKIGEWISCVQEDGTITPMFSNGQEWMHVVISKTLDA